MDGFKSTFSQLYQDGGDTEDYANRTLWNATNNGTEGCSAGNGADSDGIIVRSCKK